VGEIFKVPQRSGERGRPKNVTVLGSTDISRSDEPTVVGASVAGEPQIVDGSVTPQETLVDVRVHSEVIREGQDQIRPPVTEHPEVELRVHKVSREFDAVKRGEEEGV
jgi:hypothetical protein